MMMVSCETDMMVDCETDMMVNIERWKNKMMMVKNERENEMINEMEKR